MDHLHELGSFFATFMPHGHCYAWRPSILWTHVVSDGLIAASYYSIPLALVAFVRRRSDVAFSWIFWLFGAFIFACGTTHVLGIWTTWSGRYGIEGVVKALTAGVSAVTAVLLWPLLPRALALPSPAQLREANVALAAEVEQRRAAESELRTLNAELETIVARRTAELARHAEDLRRSNADLEVFASVVSHDLKAPLRAIDYLAQCVEEEEAPRMNAASRDNLGRLRDRTARLHAMIEGILAYSRAGETPRLEAVALDDAVRRVVAAVAPGPGIAIEVMAPMPAVCFDAQQLEQVLQNLVVNAIQHLGRPAGRVRVEAVARGDRVEVAVTDDGVGVDPEHRERIFEMFQGGDGSDSTGIGLAIVKRVVERNGGRIRAEAAPGGGARFVFDVARAGGEDDRATGT